MPAVKVEPKSGDRGRIGLELDPKRLHDLDEFAERHRGGASRSAVIREALDRLLEQERSVKAS